MSKCAAYIAPLLWLGGLHAGALGAGFFAPYSYDEQDRSAPLQPPSRLHFAGRESGLHLAPFVCGWKLKSAVEGYEEDCGNRYPIQVLVSGSRYRLLNAIPTTMHLFGVAPPGAVHLMGTDDFGRDQFSRFLFAGQVSLSAAILACTITVVLATVLGSLAGFYRGWADELIMAASEVSLSLPWLYLLLAVRALLPIDQPPQSAFLIVVCILGLVGWARPARLIRATVLSATEREFVMISRSFGASDFHVIRTHILPQLRQLLAAQGALLVPRYILAEAILSFLGLGVSEPAASWGNMLARAQHYSALASCWWLLLPGVLLIPTFMAYASLAGMMAAES